ncbi:MAG: hypothetical protein EPGJADBJ_02281 [Saprospiraceae bacterium]|nr:hypothetical protein [Saprospiraceae bacterium]
MIQSYFKPALRHLLKNARTTALNVAGLALGVAVCLTVAVWLQRETSFDDFHPDADRIFRLTNTFKSESESFSQAGSQFAHGAYLPREVAQITNSCRVVDDLLLMKANEKQFFEEYVLTADSNFFRFFGFRLVEGDPQTCLNSADKIVLTEKTARKYFGSESPIGKSVQVDEYQFSVAGVAADPPENSHIQFSAVWPVTRLDQIARAEWGVANGLDEMWLGGWPNVYLRLQDPAQREAVEAEANAVCRRHSGAEQDSNKMSYTYHLQPLRDIHLKSKLRYDAPNNGSESLVWVFAAVGLAVLLLACINYINLSTAGAMRRARETAVKKVVGASRGFLTGQFFSEALLTSAAAVALGCGLFRLFMPSFSLLTEQQYDVYLSPERLGWLAAFTLVIAALSGLYPAVALSGFQPVSAMKGNFSGKMSGNVLRKTLVVFQFSISIALIAGILIIQQQMHFIAGKNLGYGSEAVVMVRHYGNPEVNRQFGAMYNELKKSPYIKNVSRHQQALTGGLGNGWTTTTNGRGEEVSTSLYHLTVDPEFLETYGMQLAAGRFFSGQFPTDTAKACLVNEAAVRTFGWGTPENALGKQFGKGNNAKTVVGVVRDFHFENLHKPIEPLQLHFARSGGSISLKMEAAHLPDAMAHLENTWKTMFPAVPLKHHFVSDNVAKQYLTEARMQKVLGVLSGISLLIACLGLFGLSVFMVERRVKEVGVRKVLGASVAGITGLLAKDFLKLVAVAILIASPVAYYFMQKWLADFSYRIDIQWWVFAVAGTGAVAVAFLTVGFQSVRAALANPVQSLRTE